MKKHILLEDWGNPPEWNWAYKTSKVRVAILLSNALTYEHILEEKDGEGRYVLIKGNMEGTMITLLNILYMQPQTVNGVFWKKCLDIMASEGILICGSDMTNSIEFVMTTRQSRTSKKIKTMMQEVGIIDFWRELYPLTMTILTFLIPTLFIHR